MMDYTDVEDPEYQQLNGKNRLDFLMSTTSDLNTIFADKNISCNYYDEKSFFAKFKSTNYFTCLSSNVQSLGSKFLSICNFFNILSDSSIIPDIFAVQEVWSCAPNSYTIPDYSFYCKTRKNGRGGGVGLFVHKDNNSSILEDHSLFIENIYESIAVQVETSSRNKFIAISLYRPNRHKTLSQSQQFDQFFSFFQDHLQNLSQVGLPIYIFSDTNIDLMKYGSNLNSNNLLDLTMGLGYLQLISKVTRIQGESATLLDHIFSNDNLVNTSAGVIIDSYSDHFIIFSSLNFEKNKPEHSAGFSRCMKPESINNFKAALNNLSWADVLDKNCPNAAYDSFWETFSTLFDIFFPLHQVKFNKNIHPLNPYMTPGLMVSRRRKLKLYRLSKSKPTPENIRKFQIYRNIYNKTCRKSKQMYFEKKIYDSKGNSKKIWDTLGEAMNNKKVNSATIDTLLINNEPCSDETLIADNFNEYFSQIGVKVSGSVPPTDANYWDFLPPRCSSTFFINPILPSDICSTISQLEKKTSKDINGISVCFLHDIAFHISEPMAHIFNKSVQNGIFPEKMKISRTIPVYKKSGSPMETNNYRPIAIINAFSKVFEKIISKRLVNFLTQTNFFFPDQFGFLQGRSTNHAIMKIINYISGALNEDKYSILVLLDVQKAFDSISHSVLLYKLENAGIRGVALDWFRSYLSDRKQKVQVGSSISENTSNINIGVLQGSILGVILFLISVNDISNCSEILKSFLFADDISSLSSDINFNNLVDSTNFELNKLSAWYRANGLAVHPKKSKFMIFKPPNFPLPANIDLFFNDNDPGVSDPSKMTKIQQVSNRSDEKFVRVLGVLLDENLTLESHVNSMCSKISRSIYCLNQVKHFLDTNCLKLIYFSHIHSHLNYCSNIFSLLSTKHLNRVTILQKKAIRIVCKTGYRSHTNPLFLRTGILPFKDIIQANSLSFMYEYKHRILPSTFNHCWTQNWEIDSHYLLRNGEDFYLRRLKFHCLNKHPLFIFPRTWNSFSPVFKNTYMSKKQFARTVKNYFLHKLDDNFSINCTCILCF